MVYQAYINSNGVSMVMVYQDYMKGNCIFILFLVKVSDNFETAFMSHSKFNQDAFIKSTGYD